MGIPYILSASGTIKDIKSFEINTVDCQSLRSIYDINKIYEEMILIREKGTDTPHLYLNWYTIKLTDKCLKCTRLKQGRISEICQNPHLPGVLYRDSLAQAEINRLREQEE